ncbi:sugar porter family MFS transporter [Klebsiella pneumoniae]|uniref:sugar porter family MFS transporter n=1 Tax=Klebsiella pneumoniae TaxID=573 RepID=UPI00203C24C0|nr:sugar porter family MFS transporter [Klebsiella pneumoniae]USB67237.1 sugar porter family MFS transporter [Klebsiella pneumoniae]HBT4924952.1 sugar porter family MFS transporter [Klebsiella pneumoniae]
MSDSNRINARYVYSLCCLATMGGVMFGYSTGVISGTVDSIQQYFQLNSVETGWLVSSIFVGCILGSIFAGRLADKLGRKAILLLSTLAFAVSAAGSTFADSFLVFSLARIIAGFGVGLAGTVAPMYMSEISPASIRGKAAGIFNLSLVGAQTLVFFVNFLIARGMSDFWLAEEGWRWMMGAQFVPVAIMLMSTILLPESPQWCMVNGRNTDAIRIFGKIYPDMNSEEAMQVFSFKKETKNEKNAGASSVKYILSQKTLRYGLIIGCSIAVLQQFTGAAIVMYYAPLVLQTGDLSKESILFQTIFIGLLNAIGALVGMNLFDKFGRLPIMKIGTLGSILSLLTLSYSMYTYSSGYIAISSVLVFMVMFAISWGSGCWVLISEIFPPRIKGYAMGLAVGLMWVFNFSVTQVFPMINEIPTLKENFNGAFTMWIFVGMNIFCFYFLSRYIPETKGVALENIETILQERLESLSSRKGKNTASIYSPTDQENKS